MQNEHLLVKREPASENKCRVVHQGLVPNNVNFTQFRLLAGAWRLNVWLHLEYLEFSFFIAEHSKFLSSPIFLENNAIYGKRDCKVNRTDLQEMRCFLLQIILGKNTRDWVKIAIFQFSAWKI
jgi:hypothetical protein